jgi:2-phospho-L-lactate guanylyltransferase
VTALSWTVLVPIKRLDMAKSRLRGALAGVPHDDLVLAMAMDTVSAALACPVVGRVVAVTSDQAVAAAVSVLGAEVVADGPDAGLNPALAYAASLARKNGNGAGAEPGLAALAGDLPALRPAELAEALRAAAEQTTTRGYVADAAGTGTVLLAAPPGVSLEPCFGPDSAAAHAASGAVELDGHWPSLRRDVDTAADLAGAHALGLGAYSARVYPTDARAAG